MFGSLFRSKYVKSPPKKPKKPAAGEDKGKKQELSRNAKKQQRAKEYQENMEQLKDNQVHAEMMARGNVQPESKKRKKMQTLKETQEGPVENQEAVPKVSLLGANAAVKGLKSYQGKAAERLKGSRFRWINDKIYGTTGEEAKKLFEEDPTLVHAYHEGYEAQRQRWPKDPLDDVIAHIKEEVLPSKVIADFGCGEARLALELQDREVHSFDLVRVNERVTACNLAKIPLPNFSLDYAVFCLSLMGKDWTTFLNEAYRCLRHRGVCHIVEVVSRFEDANILIAAVEACGFRQIDENIGSFFIELRFEKTSDMIAKKMQKRWHKKARGEKKEEALQACTYRKR